MEVRLSSNIFSLLYSTSQNFRDRLSEGLTEPCQTSKVGIFVKIFSGCKPLTIFEKAPPWMFNKVLNTPLAFDSVKCQKGVYFFTS